MCSNINMLHQREHPAAALPSDIFWHFHVHTSGPQTCLTGRSLRCCMWVKGAVYSRVIATAVPPTGRMKGEEKRERKGMHSWWICHFGLWPGSLPITFKLAAACKTLHISHGVPHPLLGPSAPTTTLINQPRGGGRKKTGAPLSSYHYHYHFTLSLKPANSSLHANCSSHHKHAAGVTGSTHVFVHLGTPRPVRKRCETKAWMPHSRERMEHQ